MRVALCWLVLCVACGAPASGGDAGMDAGRSDAGPLEDDAGPIEDDAGPLEDDAGPLEDDAGAADAGVDAAVETDAGETDAGETDGGALGSDAGPDAGSDAGPDAGSDAGACAVIGCGAPIFCGETCTDMCGCCDCGGAAFCDGSRAVNCQDGCLVELSCGDSDCAVDPGTGFASCGSCGAIRNQYLARLSGANAQCNAMHTCQVLRGHCDIGLGNCYHAANTGVSQSELDGIAAHWLANGCDTGATTCASCPAPPSVRCDAGGCLL